MFRRMFKESVPCRWPVILFNDRADNQVCDVQTLTALLVFLKRGIYIDEYMRLVRAFVRATGKTPELPEKIEKMLPEEKKFTKIAAEETILKEYLLNL